MNATIRAQNLIELMEDLVRVLERENELLKTPRAQELTPVVEEKQALFKHYNDHIAAISQNPGFSGAIPVDLRERLRDLAESFDDLMKVNRRRLEILTKSSQHIVNRIVEAAKDAAGQVPNYSRQGGVNQSRKAAPVALNQEF